MTENPQILAERERCKQIIIDKIDAVIEWRESKRRKRFIWILEKLSKDLIWLIEHPEHKPKHKKESKSY